MTYTPALPNEEFVLGSFTPSDMALSLVVRPAAAGRALHAHPQDFQP